MWGGEWLTRLSWASSYTLVSWTFCSSSIFEDYWFCLLPQKLKQASQNSGHRVQTFPLSKIGESVQPATMGNNIRQTAIHYSFVHMYTFEVWKSDCEGELDCFSESGIKLQMHPQKVLIYMLLWYGSSIYLLLCIISQIQQLLSSWSFLPFYHVYYVDCIQTSPPLLTHFQQHFTACVNY